ncbi:LysR family transcriptional regulator [Caulobacter sp. UNC358MFTsu5.1]|uniref:LysR family transcriptional regulator n=1 Tax=Caulobacter sp. UNC358MFTsu5.1 TaxID=1449049 RepID=UPI0004A73CCF|nr:LysR family transcriptional regulator [Caulobacter sp. UNC358MFTsu5.1]
MLPRSLKTFLVVARTRNLTRAAAEVNLAQSSVSDQIQALEADFGASLFTRSRSGLEATPAGRALIPYIEDMLRLESDARRAVGDAEREDPGGLRVGALETIASTVLPARLAQFRDTRPKVPLAVQVAGSGDLRDQVLTGGIDLAFGFGSPGRDARLAEREIGAVPLRLIAPATASETLARGPAGWAQARFVVTPRGCVFRTLFDEAFAAAGVAQPIVMEVGSVAMIPELVADGAGFGLVPHLVADAAPAAGGLASAAWPGPPAALVLWWRRRRVQPEPLRSFLAMMAQTPDVR